MFRRFLAHCDEGLNALTGERGVRLDFISVHEKGSREHEEDLTPRTLGIIERERPGGRLHPRAPPAFRRPAIHQ